MEQPTLSVRVGDRKLIRFKNAGRFHYEYYDLATDPSEQNDLYATHADEAADLKALVDRYEDDMTIMRDALRENRGEGPATDVEISPDHADRLRALGYLE
jgi:hypothetical protein